MTEKKEKIIEKDPQEYDTYDDCDLIVQITKKNNLAFEEFFKRYANKVKFLMLKMDRLPIKASITTT